MIRPVPDKRYFAHEKFYSQVKWGSLKAVVTAYQEQLEYWYILPCQTLLDNGHFSFPAIALTSMLVDTLSQYELGAPKSTKTIFRNFLRCHIPETGVAFPTSINLSMGTTIQDGADALYFGIRCGILHETHAALYTGISDEGASIITYVASGLATYDSGGPCPVVSVCPRLYFKRVSEIANEYWSNLLDPASGFDSLRVAFADKVLLSYGMTISTDPTS